ncbi:MAG: bifunctional serine/threonine-protein kinase/ABC transporter substrate-binding protein [Chloroflexi bacterium]|nr:bifunctional serine/threonine-protein kinase/ABC transporter substrate-binding protein [Chloroflexota bacterium]
MTLQPGDLILNGKYRIEALIGRGAFAQVYSARHLGLNVLRAIKVLRADAPGVGSTVYKDYRERYKTEFQIAAQIDDPHVIKVHDLVEESEALYAVLEYAPGGSVADLLKKSAPLPIERALEILLDCAAGLEALHEKLIVIHRDVKPSNILLDKEGTAKIADLGLAQVGGGQSSMRSELGSVAGMHPGTPDYRSPEHNSWEPLSPTSDVYSLGCVAFEMLTGKVWKQVRHKVNRVRDLRPEVPEWLDTIVMRMLCEAPGVRAADANNPEKRYVTMEAAARALRTGMEGQARSEREVKEQAEREARERAEFERQQQEQREATDRQARMEAERRAQAEAAEKARQQEVERKRQSAQGSKGSDGGGGKSLLGIGALLSIFVCLGIAVISMALRPTGTGPSQVPTAAPTVTAAIVSTSTAFAGAGRMEPTAVPTAVPPTTALSSGKPVAAAAPAATTAPVAGGKFTCSDKLGCVDIGPNDPIHIAYEFVTSGDNSTFGLDTKYGAELAIDDAGGKVLGHTIKFDGQDEGCSAEGGQAAATKIAADKTVVAVIGTDCSSAAAASIPILMQQQGLSMISPANTSPALTDPAQHVAGYFRTAPNDKVQGAVAAQFVATQLKFTSAATIHDGSIYAQSLVNAFVDNFQKAGGKVTNQEAVNVGDKDMKPVLTRIAANKPQIIYFPIFMSEGSFICSQIRDVPNLEKVVMLSSDGTFSPDVVRSCGKNIIGMFWSSPNFAAFGSGYQTLVDKYKKTYNVPGVLAPFHAHSYDAMNIVLAALQKPGVVAKDADGTLHVQKQALRDAIAATKDFKGITGNLTCDPNGDCADPKIAIYQETADDFSKGWISYTPVWAPGGPDYRP